MAILGGLALYANQGAAETAFDYEVYIKVDGTWEPLVLYLNSGSVFTNPSNSGQYDLALNNQPTYENTGGSPVDITDICVAGVESAGDLTSSLNSDETQASVSEALVIPIHSVQGSPLTVDPAEIVQFTSVKMTIESP